MDNELVLENSGSTPVYTLQNTITYFKAVNYEYQTETDQLNNLGT